MFTFPFTMSDTRELWTPSQLTTRLWMDADDASTITLSGSNSTGILLYNPTYVEYNHFVSNDITNNGAENTNSFFLIFATRN